MTIYESSLNAFLLDKILTDQGITPDIISTVIFDLQQEIRHRQKPFDKQMLLDVFARHSLQNESEYTLEELKKDPPVLSYGTIGCF